MEELNSLRGSYLENCKRFMLAFDALCYDSDDEDIDKTIKIIDKFVVELGSLLRTRKQLNQIQDAMYREVPDGKVQSV